MLRSSGIFLLVLASLFHVPLASADDGKPVYKASSSTNAGQGNLSQALSLSGDNPTGPGEEAGAVDWSAGYTYSQTPVGNSTNRSGTIDLSLGFKQKADVGAGYSYSRTPDENLTSSGPSLWAGYIFSWGGGRDFHPSVEPKITFKTEGYKQTFSGTSTITRAGSRRTITRPTTGSEAIRQNEYSLGFDVSPFELFSVHASATSYKYDKDVSRFLGLLDTPRAVSKGAASFSDTLGGFPKSSGELGVSLFPWDSWTFSLDLSRSTIQVDGSLSTGSKIEVEKDLSDAWRLGLGFDHETSVSQGQENLTVLDLAYSF